MAAKNIFATAKVTTKPTSKKPAKPELKMGDELDTLAAIRALSKALEGLQASVESEVKKKSLDAFVGAGINLEKRPENFRGISTLASASLELKKRSSASALREDEVEVLRQHKISVTEGDATFYFNPLILQSESAMKKVSAALEKVDLSKDIGTTDIILQNPGKTTVAETSLDEVFGGNFKPVVVERLLGIVATLSVKPKLNVNDIDSAFKILKDNGLDLGAGE